MLLLMLMMLLLRMTLLVLLPLLHPRLHRRCCQSLRRRCGSWRFRHADSAVKARRLRLCPRNETCSTAPTAPPPVGASLVRGAKKLRFQIQIGIGRDNHRLLLLLLLLFLCVGSKPWRLVEWLRMLLLL